ncbi:TetR/AcrR family transcriptional regulator OS=Streptomyces tendae OX=1932 GN=F3L20_08065 PE=4 SV=1 [Streptomyces tendae]
MPQGPGRHVLQPGSALRAVIHECDTEAERFQTVIVDGVVEPTLTLLRKVIERGIERGEVRPDAANGYERFDAVPAMMMYGSKMCGSEWSEVDLEQMIDQLMVPLLRPYAS